MHFHYFLHPPSLGASKPVSRSSSSIHTCQLPRAISDLVLSLLLLGSVCMNALRLLSLEVAAAIPGSNPSFPVNRVCMHLFHLSQPLQGEGPSNRVSLSPIKTSAAPCRTASIGHANVGTSGVGQPAKQDNPETGIL
jgi:hypothetical protein